MVSLKFLYQSYKKHNNKTGLILIIYLKINFNQIRNDRIKIHQYERFNG